MLILNQVVQDLALEPLQEAEKEQVQDHLDLVQESGRYDIVISEYMFLLLAYTYS